MPLAFFLLKPGEARTDVEAEEETLLLSYTRQKFCPLDKLHTSAPYPSIVCSERG